MSDKALFKLGRYMTEAEYAEALIPITGEGRAYEVASIEYGGPGDVIHIDEHGNEIGAPLPESE